MRQVRCGDHSELVDTLWFRSRGLVWTTAILLGPVVAGVLTLIRGHVDSSHVALILVLAVAVVSAAGQPPAGLAAALTTALAFDFFWTEPYGSLSVFSGTDISTVVLLVLVGAAVELLSWWGGRQKVSAERRQSYLQSLTSAANGSGSTSELGVSSTEQAITAVLGADRTRFVPDGVQPETVMGMDGRVTRSGRELRVDVEGLPTDDVFAVPVPHATLPRAHFVVTASSALARPSLEQRQVAALLARLTTP